MTSPLNQSPEQQLHEQDSIDLELAVMRVGIVRTVEMLHALTSEEVTNPINKEDQYPDRRSDDLPTVSTLPSFLRCVGGRVLGRAMSIIHPDEPLQRREHQVEAVVDRNEFDASSELRGEVAIDSKREIVITVGVDKDEVPVTLSVDSTHASWLVEDFRQSNRGVNVRNPKAYRSLTNSAINKLENLKRKLSQVQERHDSSFDELDEVQREMEAVRRIIKSSVIYEVRASLYLKNAPSTFTNDVFHSSLVR